MSKMKVKIWDRGRRLVKFYWLDFIRERLEIWGKLRSPKFVHKEVSPKITKELPRS